MHRDTPYRPENGEPPKSLIVAARGSEKIINSKDLRPFHHAREARNRSTALACDAELLSQDGTKPCDPFWDAPRFCAAFAAQLLGQLMAERSPHVALKPTAYDGAASRTGRLLDRRL